MGFVPSALGFHTISASYVGDSTYDASQGSTVLQAVAPAKPGTAKKKRR